MSKNSTRKLDEGLLEITGLNTRIRQDNDRFATIYHHDELIAQLIKPTSDRDWVLIQNDSRKCFQAEADLIRTINTFMDIMDDEEQWLVSTQEEPGYAYIEKKGKPGHIQIKADDDGFAVDIFHDGEAVNNSVASTYAFYAELKQEEKD